jgi:hypothetical protein
MYSVKEKRRKSNKTAVNTGINTQGRCLSISVSVLTIYFVPPDCFMLVNGLVKPLEPIPDAPPTAADIGETSGFDKRREVDDDGRRLGM